MTNLNRTQSIEMWELISKGGLRDVEGQCPIRELGDMSPLEFVEQVAAKMLAANACEAKSRWAQIAMAAGLGGKMPDTESVIRRAILVLRDFDDGATVVEGQVDLSADAIKKAVNLVRSF
jgi:hypothetical protein